jgi:hypothetical protein
MRAVGVERYDTEGKSARRTGEPPHAAGGLSRVQSGWPHWQP